jgi:hypothetical protein
MDPKMIYIFGSEHAHGIKPSNQIFLICMPSDWFHYSTMAEAFDPWFATPFEYNSGGDALPSGNHSEKKIPNPANLFFVRSKAIDAAELYVF